MASLEPAAFFQARDSIQVHRERASRVPRKHGILARLRYSWHNLHSSKHSATKLTLVATSDGPELRTAIEQDAGRQGLNVCKLSDEYKTPSTFRKCKKIGTGSSGAVKIMVKKATRPNDDCRRYAVKMYFKKPTGLSKTNFNNLVESEYIITRALQHPNIVESKRLCLHSRRWAHVMEYCEAGDLFDIFRKKYLKLEDKHCIFKQLLQGVAYLHDNGIAHRDLKFENLLLTANGQIKIVDFGMAYVFDSEPLKLYIPFAPHMSPEYCKPGPIGTYPYLSPEVVAENTEYDPTKLDVWSCAIIYMSLASNGCLWEIATATEPGYRQFMKGWEAFLADAPDLQVTRDVFPCCGPLFDKALSTTGSRRCILRMLHPDPDMRCSIQDILNDKWIRNIECCTSNTEQTRRNSGHGQVVSRTTNPATHVQTLHNHLPPTKPAHEKIPKIFRCRFDLGNFEMK